MEQPPELYGNGAAGWGYRLEREGLSSSGQGGMENQQQQQQVCSWEHFFQKKTIRVLLVENDDSTRHVVSALLGHCMYQVIPAKNGQQAWTYLEDMQNNIDLVLAEVLMPGVSGISLLSRIMSHNVCKNIPVIMMSSNDAMGTVFKCLSKGAVDFLVKPIRKNELKNLWQHVWRRCHSSSGSGSESGTRTQKGNKSKSVDGSDDNSGSNDDDASIELNARDGSDNGSGTQVQSSWTKRAVEIDSPQAMSPDKFADPPVGTCVQVTHPKSDGGNRWLPGTNNGSCKDQKNDDFKRNLNTSHQSPPNMRSIKPADRQCAENHSKEKVMENLENQTVGAADLIGSMAKNMDAQQAARAPNCSSEVADEKDKNHDSVLPLLELSFKRLRSPRNGANAVQDEQRNLLRRSDPSAFTRYHTNPGGTGFVGSCSPHDNSGSEAMEPDSAHNMKSSSDAARVEQGSNGSSNNNDMGSTTKSVVTNKERVMPPSAMKANTVHTSAFHPVQHWTSPAGEAKAGEVANSAVKNQCGSSNVFDPALEGQAANYGANGSNSGSYNGTNGQNASVGGAATDTAMDKREPGGGNGSGSGSGNHTYVKRLAPAITLREIQLSKYREKRKDRNFGKKVRYQSRKRLAEQRPRVRGQFVKQQAAQGGWEER